MIIKSHVVVIKDVVDEADACKMTLFTEFCQWVNQ